MKIYFIFLGILLLAIIGFLCTVTRGEIFMKWEKIGSMIASITFLAIAILTLFMVLEMRWMREQDIIPELIVTSPIYRYEFRWIPKENLSPIIKPELRKEETNQFETRLPVFGIKNIGKATALNIEIVWTINTNMKSDFLLTNQFIKEFYPSIKGDLFCLSTLANEQRNENCFRYMKCEKTELPYCVATPSTEITQPLPLPSGISGSYEVGLIVKERPIDFSTIRGDGIHIELKYTDLKNKKFRKCFIIRSEMWYLPDSVSSESNSVDAKYHSDLNIRGTLRFSVFPAPIERKIKI